LSQAFENFIDQTVREAIVLVEITPKQKLAGWSKTAGRTNVWEITFENFVGTDIQKGGLYRKLTGLRQNDVDLTEVASIAACDAAAGSWYYDEQSLGSTSTLYCSTTGSVDPDLYTAMVSFFRIHLASHPRIFGRIIYDPRLTAEALPSVTESTEDLFWGPVKRVASGELSISNADGMFDRLSATWAWKNAKVRVYFGGDSLAHTPGGGGDYAEIAELYVESIAPGMKTMTLMVRDKQKVAYRNLPVTPIFEDNYPNTDEEVRGTRIPLLFGVKTGITPKLVDTTDNKGKYLVADPAYQTLYSIDAVYDDGVEIDAGDMTLDLTGCSLTILGQYSGTPGVVTCDATGQPARGKAWETSTDYLKYYGEIVCEIYTNYLGLLDAEIDSTGATDSDAFQPWAQAAYIQDEQSARTYIRNFERGVMGRTIRGLTGLIQPTIWYPYYPVGAPVLDDPIIMEFAPETKIETIFSRVLVRYAENPTSRRFLTRERTDNEARYVQLDGRTEDRVITTYLTTAAQAVELAERVRFVSANPDTEVRVIETGLGMSEVKIGDRILLTTARAPSADGSWTNRVMEVIQIIRSFSPIPRIELLLNNQKGVTGIGNWTTPTAADWADATEEQKQVQGFWTDDNGYIDPADESSADASRWW